MDWTGNTRNPTDLIERVKGSLQYMDILAYYNTRTAKRSGVPLMNHINEGLIILNSLGCAEDTMLAFCVHPLFQEDEELKRSVLLGVQYDYSPNVLLLVMEYRNQANQWLSEKVATKTTPASGPLTKVRDMLIADKVQNYKDFLLYHKLTHPRSMQLTLYFQMWLEHLGVSNTQFKELCDEIEYKGSSRLHQPTRP